MPINLEERLKRADEYQQRKNKMKKLFFYDWFLKQNKKKQILLLITAIFLIVSLIILVIVLSAILTRNKSTNTNTQLPPTCDLGDKEKYYGLIGTPYKICSVYDCPLKSIDCCSIINKCNFTSLLGSNVCPFGVSCTCYLNDSNSLDSCSTVSTSTSRNCECNLN